MYRITQKDVDEMVGAVNRSLPKGTSVRAQGRNGYTGLDLFQGGMCMRTITVGTKREIFNFLAAMSTGISLSLSRGG
jgi:hypothetical protein